MPSLLRGFQSDKLFLILFRKSGQYIACGRCHCASREIAALRGVVTEALERLLFHEVATHLR